MERLFYNCEKIKLSYNNDVSVVYAESNSPTDDNSYLTITNTAKQKPYGTLLHVYLYDKNENEEGIDKGLFIVDNVNNKNRLVSITCGEQFYKPLYEAYDDLIDDINSIDNI